jgi:DNA repair exonuclease SbcCD ATPase subunit
LDSKEKGVDVAIKEINNLLTIINNRVIINKEKISNENSRLNLVEGKTECPTCGEPMKGNFGKNIEKKIKTINALIKKDEAEIKDLSDKLLQVKEEKEKLNKKRKILSINGIETEKMKKMYEKINSFGIRKTTLEEQQKEIKDVVSKVISLREKIEILQEQVKKEIETKNSFQNIINDNEIKINELNEEYRNIHGSIKRLNELTDYMEYIKLICRDENIKQYAISSIIPYLTKQTNHYLSDAGSYFYARFDNWLEESIEGPGIYNCTYGNLSGAESKSIDLSIQFAFLDIARIQAGLFPDILILDELLDSSVDGTGLNNILGIIKRRQKDDDSKVYLITHRSEISDIDADRTYMVEKKEGFSYLKTY